MVHDLDRGKMIYQNGSTYTGEWVKNEKHGLGVFIEANSCKYNGQWKLGKRNGIGT